MEERYFVYLLSAGDGKWGYIGQTRDMQDRLWRHHKEIERGQKSELWKDALEEFPNPEDWEMTEIAGPFDNRNDAVAEEERLHRWAWDEPGRLWDKCGHKHSEYSKLGMGRPGLPKTETTKLNMKASWDKTRRKAASNRCSGAGNPMHGRKRTPLERAKISSTRMAKKYTKAFFEWLSEPIT